MTQTEQPESKRQQGWLWPLVLCSCLILAGVIGWRWIPRAPVETPVRPTGPLVTTMSVSRERNPRYLAAAQSDGRLRLWEVATRKELTVKLPSRLSLHDLAWTSDGNVLTGGFEQTLLLWNTKSNQASKLPGLSVQIVSIACRPASGEILVSLANGQLFLIDRRSNERISLETGHQGIVKVVRFAPDGNTFVTAGVDGKLIWHDWSSREIVRKVAAHQHEISSLEFARTGQKLVSGSWDMTAKIWDGKSDQPLATLKHPSEVAQVGWLESNIVSTSWDDELRVWSTETSSVLHESPWLHGSLAFAVLHDKREVIGVDAEGNWRSFKP